MKKHGFVARVTGAAKVSAATLDLSTLTLHGVTQVPHNAAQPKQVTALANALKHATLLVSNAGAFEAGQPELLAGPTSHPVHAGLVA